METGKKYISGEERKMTRLMLFIVSMRVSLVRVCLGGNLGTASFSSNPTHLNSTPTNNQRGERAPVPKISKQFTLS